jgi:hypothetical protein
MDSPRAHAAVSSHQLFGLRLFSLALLYCRLEKSQIASTQKESIDTGVNLAYNKNERSFIFDISGEDV